MIIKKETTFLEDFLVGTDIKDAIKEALLKCTNKFNVGFNFNDVTIIVQENDSVENVYHEFMTTECGDNYRIALYNSFMEAMESDGRDYDALYVLFKDRYCVKAEDLNLNSHHQKWVAEHNTKHN